MDKKDIIIAELQERICQLEAMLTVDFICPFEWYLTPSEIIIFATLLARPVVSKEALYWAVYSSKVYQAEMKIIDVFVSRLRKKLKPFGLEIMTVWSGGYRLNDREKWQRELCHAS